jgi:transposase
MAMEKIGMNKLREILRLKYELGLSNRQIGVSCRTTHRTIAKYCGLAKQNGLDWDKDKGLDDTELEKKVLGAVIKEAKKVCYDKVMPDWVHIHEELKRPHVTLQLLWEEYKVQHNGAGYEQSFFYELYRKWRKKLNVCMRQVHKAGEKLFVDYCDGEGIKLLDRNTGAETKTQIYVGVWGASNYTYAEASYTQEKEDWLMSHVRAFEYFDCVPYIVVPDNLKSGVNDACYYEPEINRSYTDLAEHYGFTVIPARKAHPKDKAKVEKGVNVAQRWILACLRNRVFYSLAELNAAIRELLEKLNNRKMQKIGKTRKELFEELDKPAAQPLTAKRYEYAVRKVCRVNIDYHIEIESHYYSVPYQLVHEQVEARITENVIEIFYKHRRVVSHERSYVKWLPSTKLEHMPPEHQKYIDQTPSKLIAWAGQIGQNTVEVIKKILESRKYIQQSYRSCMGIKRLEGHYSKERIENACRRAVRYQVFSYRSIKAILVGGLDKQADLFWDKTESVGPKHENIRGEGYYAGEKKIS